MPQPVIAGIRPPVGFVLHVPVLMYHRIVPVAEAGNSLPGLVVPPQLFAAQMAALAAAGWHTITAGDLAADLAAGRRPPPRTFVITFDDGYDDGFTYAYPILRAHGFVATYFVVAGRIGRTADALTPQQVQALAAAGMEIGDHTYDHIDLAAASPSVVRYEIVAAALRIQALVGRPPVSFAYPFGRYSAAVETAVREAGLQIAFTTVEGSWESWATRFDAPRLRVGPWTRPATLLALLSRYAG
ncbi:MAG: hypothetical protein C4343_07760 [Chloroflexota bacterium]